MCFTGLLIITCYAFLEAEKEQRSKWKSHSKCQRSSLRGLWFCQLVVLISRFDLLLPAVSAGSVQMNTNAENGSYTVPVTAGPESRGIVNQTVVKTTYLHTD